MKWSVQDSAELYNISEWGNGFFHINKKGHLEVWPNRKPTQAIDLLVVVEELQRRGIQLPILLRFAGVLEERMLEINKAFHNARKAYDYEGAFRGVYPIKVNQVRQVVDTVVEAGKAWQFGLEAGSKPELLTVLGKHNCADALIICNGYKDEEYVELALLARKLGMLIVLVVEKFSELELILQVADRLQVEPMIGLRARLATKGTGKWEASGGDRSKFGLSATEIVQAIKLLDEAGKLYCLQLLHYHIGSQISSIRSLRASLREAGRYFVELVKLGANLRFMDVGGGLAVDYDGSRTNFHSSANYSVQEYANTVVYEIRTVCDAADIAHPTLVTESGRALTAYHGVLVSNVLGVTGMPRNGLPESLPEQAPQQVKDLLDIHRDVTAKNYQEAYHDVVDLREQVLDMFKLGYLDLPWRAQAESIVWACLHKIWSIARKADYVPEELAKLAVLLSDIYFCNMSVFQSLPDSWAIGQIFPIMPIHKLNKKPDRHAVLADISCDSDGAIDTFMDLRDVNKTLSVHEFKDGEQYVLAFLLVGAYQESLGDLHNLFGDNNSVVITWDDEAGTYQVDHVEDGDTVTEVLNYVQHKSDDLVALYRKKIERAVRKKKITLEEARSILDTYRAGFDGYTYLEGS